VRSTRTGPLTARSLWPAPANLTLTFTNPDQISLAWQPVSGVPGYLVFRKTIWDTDYRPLTATPQTATTYSDIWYAMPAWYYVKAVDGAQSNIVEFKPPPSP
jgi:hypothetical protein